MSKRNVAAKSKAAINNMSLSVHVCVCAGVSFRMPLTRSVLRVNLQSAQKVVLLSLLLGL